MKKFVLFAILFVCASGIQAQEFFFKVNGGYAWPGLFNTESVLGPQVNPAQPQIDALVNMATINDSARTYKPTHGSYGKGANVSVRFGYMINQFIGVDLGITYLRSANITCNQVRAVTGPIYGTNPQITLSDSFYLNADISTYAYGVSLQPSLTITAAKTGWKVYPYGRLGLSLPVWGKVIHNVTIDEQSNLVPFTKAAPFFLGPNTQVQLQTAAEVSIGVNASIGVAYRPIPLIEIFLEVGGQYLNVRAKSSTITEWNANGVSQLTARGLYRTQFNYVDQLGPNSNNAQTNPNYNPNQPKEDVRPTAPFSNLGLNAGVTIFLSKKTVGKDRPKKQTPTSTKKIA